MTDETPSAWRAIAGPIVAAGLVGGVLVGAAESVWTVALGTAWPSDHALLRWGALLYGLLGGLVAIGFAMVAAVVFPRRRLDPFDVLCLALGVVLSASLLVVFRFRYERDLIREMPLGVVGQAMWLGAALVVGVLCWRVLPAVLRRWNHGWRSCVLAVVLVVGCTMTASWLLPRSGTAPFQAPSSAQAPRPHILYVMIDTVRADALSPYGARDVATPGSARLAADGIVFEQAISQAPWTRPSVATQLTSLPPHRHGARYKSSSIRADAVLLPEVLAAAGYYCLGFYDVGHIAPEWGFGRGFHRYWNERDWSFGPLTVARFLRQTWLSWRRTTLRAEDLWLSPDGLARMIRDAWAAAPRGAPIFAFVHVMDAHDPYFPRSTPGDAIMRDEGAPGTERDRFHAAYRDGVAAADAKVQALLAWLDAEGLYDDTLIVLVSDHGDEFFEHGGYWHGLTLYDELIHVPLIVKLPGNRLAGSRQPALVRLLDLAPTIATIVGVPTPSQWMGVSLVRDGTLADPQRLALSETDLEGGTLRAIRSTSDKLILAAGRDRRKLPPRALFDLAVDADEQRNIAADHGAQASRLEAELARERDGDLWR